MKNRKSTLKGLGHSAALEDDVKVLKKLGHSLKELLSSKTLNLICLWHVSDLTRCIIWLPICQDRPIKSRPHPKYRRGSIRFQFLKEWFKNLRMTVEQSHSAIKHQKGSWFLRVPPTSNVIVNTIDIVGGCSIVLLLIFLFPCRWREYKLSIRGYSNLFFALAILSLTLRKLILDFLKRVAGKYVEPFQSTVTGVGDSMLRVPGNINHAATLHVGGLAVNIHFAESFNNIVYFVLSMAMSTKVAVLWRTLGHTGGKLAGLGDWIGN